MIILDGELLDKGAEEHAREVWGAYYDSIYEEASSDMSYGEVACGDFICGAVFAERNLKPMFVEFGNWCVENYVSFNDHDGNLYWLRFQERKTTTELFDLWLDSRQK